MRMIGDELKRAVSAIISDRDCPPESWVTFVSRVNFSPANELATAKHFSTTAAESGIIRLFACISRNSCTVRSMTKFMFCESWATSFPPVENLLSRSGTDPLMRICRAVGVSRWARHSISSSNLLFPEPVGPTMLTTSPGVTVSSSISGLPVLSRPPRIVMEEIVSIDSSIRVNASRNALKWNMTSSRSSPNSSSISSSTSSRISGSVFVSSTPTSRMLAR